jgi:hypothetical protein
MASASSWWQHRQWRFIADMDRDGAIAPRDFVLWIEWLYFLPGDALIALMGSTGIAELAGLTPASMGSGPSAAISALAWLLAVFWLPRAILDAADPTYRDRRLARREARKRARARRRPAVGRRPARAERIEPS